MHLINNIFNKKFVKLKEIELNVKVSTNVLIFKINKFNIEDSVS